MRFELIPVLDKMIELYQHPATFERFKQYLKLLSGDTNNDMELPLGAYNPMGKEHVLHKIELMRAQGAEKLAADAIAMVNKEVMNTGNDEVYKVFLCLSDDLKGGWTNRYTSDYDSKFKLNALVARHFCTPIFWTGENIDEQIIKTRTSEYCYRTVCWLQHPKPVTLKEHIVLEARVAKMMNNNTAMVDELFAELNNYYEANKDSTNYLTIFNFLYGDEAATSLGYAPLGIKQAFAGYQFASEMARRKLITS